MKRLILTIILFSSFIIVFGQEDYHIVLLKKKDQSKIFTYNSKNVIDNVKEQNLNSVLNKYKAKNFFKTVKNAKKAKYDDLYELHIQGNLEQFKEEIELSGEFLFHRELEKYYIETCTNPLPLVNDTWVEEGWTTNWGMNIIDSYCAWSLTTGDPSISVAFADTEFEWHEDSYSQFSHISGPITDLHPHGAWTTGNCSPKTNNNLGIAGIGYNTTLAGYRVAHNMVGNGAYGSPYSAIMDAYNDGRKIINVSWTGTGLTVQEATEITDNGTVLVLAAGNSPTSTDHFQIADIPGVIVVSSVDINNEHAPTNHAHNQWVDLCSPGSSVITTNIPDRIIDNNPDSNFDEKYMSVWGTSNAAPFVSGTVALMIDVNKCLSPAELELVLEDNCDPINDAALFPGLLGAGRLNAYKAVLGAIEEGTNYVTGNLFGTSTKTGLYVSSLNTTIINSGGDVTFKAEKYTTLEPGFEVKLGAEFEILSGSYLCNQIVFPRDPLSLP